MKNFDYLYKNHLIKCNSCTILQICLIFIRVTVSWIHHNTLLLSPYNRIWYMLELNKIKLKYKAFQILKDLSFLNNNIDFQQFY